MRPPASALLTEGTDDANADPYVEGDPYRTLFLGRLAPTTTEGRRKRIGLSVWLARVAEAQGPRWGTDTLRAALERYGEVVRVRLVRNLGTSPPL